MQPLVPWRKRPGARKENLAVGEVVSDARPGTRRLRRSQPNELGGRLFQTEETACVKVKMWVGWGAQGRPVRSGQSGRVMWKGGLEAKSLGPQQPNEGTWILSRMQGAATQSFTREWHKPFPFLKSVAGCWGDAGLKGDRTGSVQWGSCFLLDETQQKGRNCWFYR